MHLLDVRGWFARDPFFKFDYIMTKCTLCGYASCHTVNFHFHAVFPSINIVHRVQKWPMPTSQWQGSGNHGVATRAFPDD